MTINDILLNHGIAAATGGEIKDINGVKYKPVMGAKYEDIIHAFDSNLTAYKSQFHDDGANIYVGNGSYVYKLNRDTLDKEAQSAYLVSNQTYYMWIVSDATYIYVLCFDAGYVIKKLDKATLTVQNTSLSFYSYAWGLAMDDTRLYVMHDTANNYWKVSSVLKSNMSVFASISTRYGSDSIALKIYPYNKFIDTDGTHVFIGMDTTDGDVKGLFKFLCSDLSEITRTTTASISCLELDGDDIYYSTYGTIRRADKATFTTALTYAAEIVNTDYFLVSTDEIIAFTPGKIVAMDKTTGRINFIWEFDYTAYGPEFFILLDEYLLTRYITTERPAKLQRLFEIIGFEEV